MISSAAARNGLGLAGLLLLTGGTPSVGDEGVSIVGQGFCIKKTDMTCDEVALPETTMQLDRLPKLPDGTRVIYFYSDQTAGSESLFVHALESVDFDHAVDVVIPQATAAKESNLPARLKALAEKVGQGAVTVTAFRVGKSGEKAVRVFSSMPVQGPGVVAGQVVDLDGKAVSRSMRESFTIIRGTSNPGGARDTMGVIDADG